MKAFEKTSKKHLKEIVLKLFTFFYSTLNVLWSAFHKLFEMFLCTFFHKLKIKLIYFVFYFFVHSIKV